MPLCKAFGIHSLRTNSNTEVCKFVHSCVKMYASVVVSGLAQLGQISLRDIGGGGQSSEVPYRDEEEKGATESGIGLW